MTDRRRPRLRPPRSARQRLRAVVGATVAAILALLLVSLAGIGLVHHEQRVIVGTLGPAQAANLRVLQSMTDAETGVRGYLLTRDPAFLEPYDAALPVLRAALAELDRFSQRAPDLAPALRSQRQGVDTWLAEYAAPAVAGPPAGPGRAPAQVGAKEVFDGIRADNARIAAALHSDLLEAERLSTEVAVVGLVGLLGIAVASVIAGVRPALRALEAIGPPLERLAGTVRRLEAGELAARADPSQGVAEVRQLARAFNGFADASEARREQLDHQLRLAAVVRSVALTGGSTLDLGEIIDQSVVPIYTGFGCDGAWARAFEGEGEVPGRGRGVIYPNPGPVPAPIVQIASRAARTLWPRQAVLQINDQRSDPDDVLSPADAAQLMDFVDSLFGARNMMMAPLGAGKEALGYFGMVRTLDGAPWTVDEVAAASRMGRDIGQAVLNARIYEREQSVIEALRGLDAQKDAFVSMVSHELRTPLASIIGHLEVVRAGDLGDIPAAADRSLAAIERNSARLTSLIEDLLFLSKVEEGAKPLDARPIELAALVQETVESLQRYAAQRDVTVRVSANRPIWVEGEHHELERVVNNLVTNAAKFSPAGAEVDVSAEESDGVALVTVVDRGLGISPADQAQLFTRYFRSTNPQAHQVPGTGLGLNIVGILVERHGGTIGVESVLGQGSTFSVRLPTVPEPITDVIDVALVPHEHRATARTAP